LAQSVRDLAVFGIQRSVQLFEWAVGVITGDSAENFLGTQGYIWDTQSDMAMALAGAILALLVLSRIHDRQLELLADKSCARFNFPKLG
jgi:putative membrane protein